MKELGLKQEELADQLNDALREITGRQGDISDRTVRNWLAGTHRRPIGRTCAALERVFGCPVGELGFSAPRSMQTPRRILCGAASSSPRPPERQSPRSHSSSNSDRSACPTWHAQPQE
ncbi:helix-turn-helix domain-containing protein [Streptomyces scabiei]|uniref:helix-turn-helix domain-containing protein n=1 Tax=Streptomyces scabiei TaxID=1930 RepID=UPI001FF32B6E|nr:helix-turn-helix transcriptional regulator [Streptomyces sp. LBUM 1481]